MADVEKKAGDALSDPGTPSTDFSRPDSGHEDIISRPRQGEDVEAGPAGPPDLSLQKSSSRSVFPPPEKVPRNQRRGLLGRLSLISEVYQPYHYARRTKWLITMTVAMSAAAAPMGSAIILPTLLPISHEFKTTPTITNLSVALYMLSMSIFPLWWSSFSETTGRRTIYLISFTLFVLFAVLSALAKSIAMLVVMRMLSGGAAASVQAVGAGTIADIWQPQDRGRAMGIFYLGPLCGPLFAPIIGGALAQGLGWRSTQWFLAIYGVIIIMLVTFVLPETLQRRRDVVAEAQQQAETEAAATTDAEKGTESSVNPGSSSQSRKANNLGQSLTRTTTRQSAKVKTKKWIKVAKRTFVDPLKIILLLRFPAVAITVFYASVTFGCLYCLNISIEDTFSQKPYEFSTLIIGLLYIPNSIGYFLASIFGGRWLDYIMKREARKAGRIDAKGKLIYRPEDRMRENAWLAAILFPAALLWYGWAVQKGVFWIVPVSFLRKDFTRLKTDDDADDCEFLLRHRLNDHLCHGHDDADRVHVQARFERHCDQQLRPQHFLVRGWYCRCAADPRHRERVAVHNSLHFKPAQWNLHDLGDEAVRPEMACGDG